MRRRITTFTPRAIYAETSRLRRRADMLYYLFIMPRAAIYFIIVHADEPSIYF